MIRHAMLISCLIALPAIASAQQGQQAADIFQSALYAKQLDRSCQILSVEGRTYADHLISQIYSARTSKTEDMIRTMQNRSEAIADQALSAGCTTAA